MNRLLIIISCFLFLFAKPSFAQDSSFDDRTRIFELLDMARKIQDADSIRVVLKEAFNLANSIDDEWAVQRTLAEWSYFEKRQGNLSVALRYALQVIREDKKDKEVNTLIQQEMMIQMGDIYQLENLNNQAKRYYLNALKLIGDGFEISEGLDLYEKIGISYFKSGQPDSAMIYFNEIETFHLQNNHQDLLIKSYQLVVDLHKENANPQEALLVNEKIKTIVEKKGDLEATANIYNNIGYSHSSMGNYFEAIEYFEETLERCKRKEYVNLAALYNNMGITYHNLNKPQKAISFLRKAEKELLKKGDNNQDLASVYHTLAVVYLSSGDLYNAQLSVKEAKSLATQQNNQRLLTDIFATAANVSEQLYEYENALDYYQRHLSLRDSFLLEERKRQQDLLQQQFLLNRAEKEIRLLMVQQDVQKLIINQLNLEKTKIALESEKLQLENKTKADELLRLEQEQILQQTNLRNQELEAERTQQELFLTAQRLEAEKKERTLSELRQKEEFERLKQQNLSRENDLLKKDKDLLTKDKNLLTQQQEIDRLELERQQDDLEAIYILSAIGTFILLMILAGLFYSRRANQKLAKQNVQIENQKQEIEKSHQEVEMERQKSEEILLNILPVATAQELKEKGSSVPKSYKMVSVLFSDFVGFTQISEQMETEELIQELNVCFIKFDEIIERHGMEKIKTIGDSYMCAGGIPVANETNAHDAVAAAIEMQTFIKNRRAAKQKENKPYWGMRVGVHTGEVIAGVVGKKKFAYDIWGDTVNLASRMESSGADEKINISEATYQYVKNQYYCEYRGGIVAKNKGSVDMYFVINEINESISQ